MLTPLAASKWNETTAAHLLNRAGFGGTPADVEKLVKLGLEKAVSHLVDYEKIPDDTSPPGDWANREVLLALMQSIRDLAEKARDAKTEEEKRAFAQKRLEANRDEQREQVRQLLELRGWWLRRMAEGPRPLQEKLTLFWHGHFATSVQKVKATFLMYLQNETFRQLGSGNWLTLLEAVTKDPAMLIWLDQAQSRKEHPNENYAREVMELFALGEGNYTEKDVTEGARAFTGYTLNRGRAEYEYRAFMHDNGVKTVLGKTGNLGGMDVLEQIVAQPQAARFISAKLWRFFAAENPSSQLIETLANVFRRNGNNFKPLLRTMFLSEEFYADSVIRTQVKSPVQWLVSSVRMLEHELPGPVVCTMMLRQLGQELFAPPNVKGWDGGLSWITTNNLLARYNLAATLVLSQMTGGGEFDRRRFKAIEERAKQMAGRMPTVDVSKILSPEQRQKKEAIIPALEKRFLQAKLKDKQRQVLRDYLDNRGPLDDEDIRQTIRLIMSTPEYQLT